MAKMIPSEVEKDEFHRSFGEENVFNALKKLPEEYVVFHSVHWNRKNDKGRIIWGEADFTVFHPLKGLIVIEVKSGGIKHYEGKWTQINTITNERYNMKDPMVQAERSKFIFANIIESTDEEIHNYWVEAAVWFPSVESHNTIGDLPPAYAVQGNVLTKNDLSNPQKSIEKIFDYYNMSEKLYYNKLDSNKVISTLSPTFDAIPSIANDLNEQEYYFNRMTQQQSFLLDYLEEQRVAAIQGAAGTGKTMLAVEKARRLSLNDNVLFLCFNKYLLNFLKEKYSTSLPNVDFYNLHSLVCSKMQVVEAGGDLGISDYLNTYDKYLWPYKHIIIDEGQDFSEEHIEILSTIASIHDGSFYVFFDKNQLVQQRQSLDWVNTIDCRLVLSINCRNTKSIATTSNKSIGIDKVTMRQDIVGQKPTLYIVNSHEELLKGISNIIRFYTNNGLTKKQIVILTAKTEETSSLYGINSIGGYRLATNQNSNDIFFTSSRKFKGLESDVIIMVDVDDVTFKTDEERRVFYVGTSRAKHRLDIISCLTENQLTSLCECITGKKAKNPKLNISTTLKVKIASSEHL